MSEIIKYYSNLLNDLNKKYNEYTKFYVSEFVEYKIPIFSCSLLRSDLNSLSCLNSSDAQNSQFIKTKNNIDSLNTEYINIITQLKSLFVEQTKYVNSFQIKIDELNEENKELQERSTTIVDTSSTSKPFFKNERILYYRSIIYLISIIIGIIFVVYMLQATPFIEIASSNTKNLAGNAAKGAKGLIENAAAGSENPDGTDSNNMIRNIIIFVLISAVIISVFYFIIYVLRKVNPPLKQTETEKEIKRIADTCLKDKSDSWFNSQLESLKTFLTNKK